MAKKKLSIFNDNNTIDVTFLEIIHDPVISNRYKNISDYIEDENVIVDRDDYKHFIIYLEKQLLDGLYYLQHLLYHIMQESGDWGEAGEQQVKTSFCYNLLGLKPSELVTYKELREFEKRVEQNLFDLSIKDISLEQARLMYSSYEFKFLGNAYSCLHAVKINKLLHFCGSNMWMYGRRIGAVPSFIYGQGKAIHKAEYEIVFFTNELVRSPNITTAVAAMVGDTDIFVREESLETIFYQKWLSVFADAAYLRQRGLEDEFWNVSLGIKKHCIHLFGADSYQRMEDAKKTFLKDMRETIYYHEIGHGLVQDYLLPAENAAVGEGTQVLGETILTSLSEFLADFSYKKGALKGPIWNMIEISKKDKTRAERMYFMYFSDTWFYDTEDDYMFIYSDLMALILLKYIRKDLHVDFDKLERDLFVGSSEGGEPGLFKRLFDLYFEETEHIKKMVKNTTFKVAGDTLSFESVKQIRTEAFKKHNPNINMEKYEYFSPLWHNMMNFMIKLSDNGDKLVNYIEKQKEIILKKVMIAACGRKKAEAYRYDHRRYIIDKCKELGLTGI
ncbi:hypothetical protein ACFL96_01755 [Thermoproteota archaeon]